jgi:hypothetical protein
VDGVLQDLPLTPRHGRRVGHLAQPSEPWLTPSYNPRRGSALSSFPL